MLEHVTREHFQPLLNQPCPLLLPDGTQLSIEIQAIEERPRSHLPESARMAFSVMLRSLEPTDFVDGLCSLDVPGERLNNVFVSREPAMGRDANLGYYCIVFN